MRTCKSGMYRWIRAGPPRCTTGFRFVASGHRFEPGLAHFVACVLRAKVGATNVRVGHQRKNVESGRPRRRIEAAIEDAVSGLQGTFRTRRRIADETPNKTTAGTVPANEWRAS